MNIQRTLLIECVEIGIAAARDEGMTDEQAAALRNVANTAEHVGANYPDGCPWAQAFVIDQNTDPRAVREAFVSHYDDALIVGLVSDPIERLGFWNRADAEGFQVVS